MPAIEVDPTAAKICARQQAVNKCENPSLRRASTRSVPYVKIILILIFAFFFRLVPPVAIYLFTIALQNCVLAVGIWGPNRNQSTPVSKKTIFPVLLSASALLRPFRPPFRSLLSAGTVPRTQHDSSAPVCYAFMNIAAIHLQPSRLQKPKQASRYLPKENKLMPSIIFH
jgi:hypothetical protein